MELGKLDRLTQQVLLDKLVLEEARARFMGRQYNASALEYLRGRLAHD
jgi:hypothetical protein